MNRQSHDDNPYEPPRAALQPLDARPQLEAHTPNGSFVKVGERKLFTAGWIARLMVAQIVSFFAHLGACGLIAWWLYDLAAVPIEAAAILGLAGFVLTYFLFRGWYVGNTSAANLLRNAGFRNDGGFFVELNFLPRLPLSGTEALDTADDVGVLGFEDQFLAYKGDRVQMRLDARDVAAIQIIPAALFRACEIGSDLTLDFREPILGRGQIRFGIREGLSNAQANRRSRKMCERIQEWFQRAYGRAA